MTSPLQEPTFLILTALAGAPLHGYALIQEVATLSDDRVRLRPGTLYGALDRLSEQGLVEVASEEIVEGRLRRSYRLTDAGAGVLEGEVLRLRANAAAAARRLGRRDPGKRDPGKRDPGKRGPARARPEARPA